MNTQQKPLKPKEYFFALAPYIKTGQWQTVRESLRKRRAARNGQNIFKSLVTLQE